MMKFIFVLLILFGISSCGSESLFLDNNNNFIVQNNEKYVIVNYRNDKTINIESHYQFKIVNTNNHTINIFSTVLENSSMFYSKKNFKESNKVISFDSYYKNFMADAAHSGERKFNFIVIPPRDSLTININPELVKNIETMILRYYYFVSDKNSNLIKIDKTDLLSSTLQVSLRK